ncbi:hypothetical protein KY363_02815 [Candidatus Woesearchaeota archaeon]|nr:hypothetical protein [Candidatus Woesearchaeota archaeon]
MSADKRGEKAVFKETLAMYDRYIDNSSRFYQRLIRANDVLTSVRELPGHHGVTLFIMGDDPLPSNLEEFMEEATEDAVPFNGRRHTLNDFDIADAISARRELDGALLVEPDSSISYAGLELKVETSRFKSKYGIPNELNINAFLGYGEGSSPLGMRNRSALYTSDLFKRYAAIMLLGENKEIGLFYCGDRLYNSAGRAIHWEAAERLPRTREAKVVHEQPQVVYVEPRHPATLLVTQTACQDEPLLRLVGRG